MFFIWKNLAPYHDILILIFHMKFKGWIYPISKTDSKGLFFQNLFLGIGLLDGFTPLILMIGTIILIHHGVSIILINRTFNLFDGLDKIGFVIVVDGYQTHKFFKTHCTQLEVISLSV